MNKEKKKKSKAQPLDLNTLVTVSGGRKYTEEELNEGRTWITCKTCGDPTFVLIGEENCYLCDYWINRA